MSLNYTHSTWTKFSFKSHFWWCKLQSLPTMYYQHAFREDNLILQLNTQGTRCSYAAYNYSSNHDILYISVKISSVCIVSDWTTGWSGFDPRQRQIIFPLSSLSRPTVGHTQPHVRWVPGILSPWVKRGRGVTLTTHPHLVPRSRMCRSYTSSPPSASMACSGTALPLSVKILILISLISLLYLSTDRSSKSTDTLAFSHCWNYK
jgi:hypothetical protein